MVNTTKVDIAHGREYPTLGSPAYGATFRTGRPEEIWTDRIFLPGDICNRPPGFAWRPWGNSDPLSESLHAPGAAPAESYVFRMLGSNFQECLLRADRLLILLLDFKKLGVVGRG